MDSIKTPPGNSTNSDLTATDIPSDERAPPGIAGQPIAGLPAAFVGTQTSGNHLRASVHSASPSTASDAVRDIKCEILANWLHAKSEEKLWINDQPGEGVFVKKTKGNYAHYPPNVMTDGRGIYDAIAALNVRVGWQTLLDP
jgi:hypothetical protein